MWVIHSPLQMAADLPENYMGHPTFRFIEDVPTDWAKSITVDGEVGEYIISARQDKHSSDWYLGAITNESARNLTVSLAREVVDQDRHTKDICKKETVCKRNYRDRASLQNNIRPRSKKKGPGEMPHEHLMCGSTNTLFSK